MMRRLALASAVAWPLLVWADGSALRAAAEAGDLKTLRQLLDAGTPVDARDARRRTTAMWRRCASC